MASRRVDRRPAIPETACSKALANVTSTATWNRTPSALSRIRVEGNFGE